MSQRNCGAVRAESLQDFQIGSKSIAICLMFLSSSALTRYQNYSRRCILRDDLSASLKADEAAVMILDTSFGPKRFQGGCDVGHQAPGGREPFCTGDGI